MKIRTSVFLCNLLVITMVAITFSGLLLAKNAFEQMQAVSHKSDLLLGLAEELQTS